MSAFNGKWHLTDIKNGQQFYDAIKSPSENQENLRQIGAKIRADPHAYYEEVTANRAEGTLRRAVYIHDKVHRDSGTVKSGVEFAHQCADGRPVKSTFWFESDTKLKRHEVGDGFTIDTIVEVDGDTMTATLTGNGVSKVMTYKRM
jgi:hypothetical protein